MDVIMKVPPDIKLPEEVGAELAVAVEHVNLFLVWARKNMAQLEAEVERLGKIRGTIPIHNGPSGILILDE